VLRQNQGFGERQALHALAAKYSKTIIDKTLDKRDNIHIKLSGEQ